MKTLKELKDKLKNSPQRLNLLYQWVKTDTITYKAFVTLSDHIKYIEEREKYWDE